MGGALVADVPKKKLVLKKLTETTHSTLSSDQSKKPQKKIIHKSKPVPDGVASKKIITKKTPAKKEKLFPKLGQTKPTPGDRDPLRKFYTSLLEQKPDSEMAIKWCTDHGLFPNQPDNIHITLARLTI
jgi:hypothetical protein